MEGGLTWQSALMVNRSGRRAAVVGNFDVDLMTASGDWQEVVGYVESIREALLETLESLVGEGVPQPRIAVNFSGDDPKSDGLSHGMFLQLKRHLEETRFAESLVSAEEIVMALRSRKTDEEVARLSRAIGATAGLFAELASFARIGCSEREVYDAVQQRMDERGLGYGWDRTGNPIVNTGPESTIGHGGPSSEITIAPGHILHLDLGVVVDGYSSDMQRSWYIAEAGQSTAPDDVKRACAAVVGAISAAAEVLRPGLQGWQVDQAARSFIVDQGYPEFAHAAGHQVGRMAHDGGGILGPRWERYGRMPVVPIEAGQVYTLELGVSVPQRGYLGLEEMVLVTEAGCEWLTDRQLEVPVLAGRNA
jgi:Xaa-Pro aminopeptidase